VGTDTDAVSGSGDAGHDAQDEEPAARHGSSRQKEMLHQVQEMIDQLGREARPVMREFAAKSAELAALAAQRAGPLAAKAAEKTQVYGERFAARSKEVAADLRRQEAGAEGPSSGQATDQSAAASSSSELGLDQQPEPERVEEPESVAGAPDAGGTMHPWGEVSSGDHRSGDEADRAG
jgi:hypothetical protein